MVTICVPCDTSAILLFIDDETDLCWEEVCSAELLQLISDEEGANKQEDTHQEGIRLIVATNGL